MTLRNPEREAAFEFGRRLADADFRKIVAVRVSSRDQDVVVALDETPVIEVLDRIFTRCRPPALVAIRRPGARRGFAFVVVEPCAEPAGRGESTKMAPNTSIGMLYDSMLATHGQTFDIGEHFAYNFEPVDTERVLADA